jgi:hypothetical protein
MPTTRKTIKRSSVRRITAKALSLFDTMEELAERCSCTDVVRECDACREWWNQHSELHHELKLRPWEWPAYSDFADDDPQAMARYRALKTASDARKAK